MSYYSKFPSLLVGGGVVPFDPMSVPIRRWYDATDPANYTQSSGSVDELDDLSGNEGHVANTGSLRPSVQDGFIRFTAAQYLFNAMPCLTQGNESCVYMVVKGDPQTNGTILGEGGTSGSAQFVYMTGNGTSAELVPFYIADGSVETVFNASVGVQIADGNKKIIRMHYDHRLWQGYANGEVGGTPRAHNTLNPLTLNRFTIAGQLRSSLSYGGAYDVYEIIIAPDDTYGLEFEGYLAHKHGLTADLPAWHPYKVNPPIGVPDYSVPTVSTPIVGAVVGDSLSIWNFRNSFNIEHSYESSTGWLTSYNMLSKQRVHFPIENVIGNEGAGTATHLANMIANLGSKDFDVCFIRSGSGDISNNVGPNTIISNLTKMFHHVIYTLGKKVVWTNIDPRDVDAGKAANIVKVNEWGASQHGKYQGRLMALETASSIDDGTGFPVANSTYDNLHHAPYGGRLQGQRLAELLLPYYGEGSYDFTTGNLLSNGGLNGTGGSVGAQTAGDVATGFTAFGSGGTGGRTASKDTDGAQLLSMAVTGGTDADYLRLEQSISAGFTVGDTVYAQALVEFVGTPTNIYGNSLTLSLTGSSLPTLVSVKGNRQFSNAYMVPEQYGAPTSLLLIQTPDLPIAAGTGLGLSARYEMLGNSATTPTNGQVKIHAMGVFKR